MALMRKLEQVVGGSDNGSESHTVLGPKASFEGKLIYQGRLKIDGEFKGDIETADALVLGESAVVHATVKVGSLVVRGVFTGTAQVKEKTELLGQAKFYGNITTDGLIVEEGVVFEGECHMKKAGSDNCEQVTNLHDISSLLN